MTGWQEQAVEVATDALMHAHGLSPTGRRTQRDRIPRRADVLDAVRAYLDALNPEAVLIACIQDPQDTTGRAACTLTETDVAQVLRNIRP